MVIVIGVMFGFWMMDLYDRGSHHCEVMLGIVIPSISCFVWISFVAPIQWAVFGPIFRTHVSPRFPGEAARVERFEGLKRMGYLVEVAGGALPWPDLQERLLKRMAKLGTQVPEGGDATGSLEVRMG